MFYALFLIGGDTIKKKVKTVDDFIEAVNRAKEGQYNVTQPQSPPAPLDLVVCFDSARWDYIVDTEIKVKSLVLFSSKPGCYGGRIRITKVQGVEYVQENENGTAYAIIAGDEDNLQRYIFYLKNADF